MRPPKPFRSGKSLVSKEDFRKNTFVVFPRIMKGTLNAEQPQTAKVRSVNAFISPETETISPPGRFFGPFWGIKRPRRHELFRVHSVINGPFAFIQRVWLFWNHVCILLKWCFCPFLLLTLLAPVLSVTMSLRRPARDPGGQGAATGAHGRGATGRGARGAATKRRNARLTAFWVRAAQL